jgi:protein-tyrosine phosphatase
MLINILFVDKADTFRAPVAKFIFKNIIKSKNLSSFFFIDTAGLSELHEGEDMIDDAKNVLNENQISYYMHESERIKNSDYERFDYIITMEESQKVELINIFGGDNEYKISKLLDYVDDSHDIEFPKNGDYSECYNDLAIGCQALVDKILEK